MIYNAPAKTCDTITISGQGAVTLTPPNSGLYQGITFFQYRKSNLPLSITGNGATSITGIIYAATATLNLTGNGGLDAQGNPLDTIGSELIADKLVVSGNGRIRVSSATATNSLAVVARPEGESVSPLSTATVSCATNSAALRLANSRQSAQGPKMAHNVVRSRGETKIKARVAKNRQPDLLTLLALDVAVQHRRR
jgi:hypothetical protein